jgi:hypothetical protein
MSTLALSTATFNPNNDKLVIDAWLKEHPKYLHDELHNFLANKQLRNTPHLDGIAEAILKSLENKF